MTAFPRSPSDRVGRMVWFARMLDKIRLMESGRLPIEYHPFPGKGFDGRCVRYLRVAYGDLVRRGLEGGTDEEILEWCLETGRRLSDEDIETWNGFISKRGLRDSPEVIENLEGCKDACGLAHRKDIDTFFLLDEVDEGRLR